MKTASERRAYHQAWYEANKESVQKRQHERYIAKKPEYIARRKAQWQVEKANSRLKLALALAQEVRTRHNVDMVEDELTKDDQ